MDLKDFWNKRYSEDGFAYGLLPNDFLAAQFHLLKPQGKILCLSEGEGRNAFFLASKGFHVTAVDLSEVGMAKLKERAIQENMQIETIVSDLAVFDIGENKWDGIISIFAHLPPDLRKFVHAGVEKGLKADGVFLLEAYRPEQITFGTGGPPSVDMMMSQQTLSQELPHLKCELIMEIERDIHEGNYHNGRSAVVQFIGRK